MSNEKNKDFSIDDEFLNNERTDIRTGNKMGNFDKETFDNLINNLIDIPNINKKMLIDLKNFINSNRSFLSFISTIFPYQLFFNIIMQNPHNQIKGMALNFLGCFSESPSFPFNEFINSPYFHYLFELMKVTKKSVSIFFPIITIFTSLLKTNPEIRNLFIEEGILFILKDKLISKNIPEFLRLILTIHPILPPECISQINSLYHCLLHKIISYNQIQEGQPKNNLEKDIIENTLKSLIKLLKIQFSPFDFSFILEYIEPLLFSNEPKIICQTARILGFLPFPTIQFAQNCIDISIRTQNWEIFHTLMKVFIRKHDEWIGFQEQIVESCLIFHENSNPNFNDELLCLKTMFLYFEFNRVYDKRVCDLLVEFVNFPEVSQKCLECLISILENAEFENDEKNEFMEMIEASNESFQILLEETDDENVSRLVNYFLQHLEGTA